MAAVNVTTGIGGNASDPPSLSSSPGLWVVAVLDGWGILSSLILLILIWTRTELRYTSQNWLISNATFACLLACCLVTPAIIHEDLALQTLPTGYCFLYGVFVWVTHLMVPLTLLMVLIDRICYVSNPDVYRRRIGRGVVALMALTPWLLSTVLAVCAFIPFDAKIQQLPLVQEPDDYKNCIVLLGFEFLERQAEFVVTFYYAFPVILLVAGMFVMMIVIAHRRHCCVSHLDEFDFEFGGIRESICQAVVPISMIVFVYFMLLLPSLVIIFKGIESGQELSAMQTAMWVFISFEWIQPVLWIGLVADFRNSLYRVFCSCCIEEGTESTDDFKFEKADKPIC